VVMFIQSVTSKCVYGKGFMMSYPVSCILQSRCTCFKPININATDIHVFGCGFAYTIFVQIKLHPTQPTLALT
jgi:hypothetical protein